MYLVPIVILGILPLHNTKKQNFEMYLQLACNIHTFVKECSKEMTYT